MQREQFAAHAELEDRHWWFTGRREILRALLQAVAPAGKHIALADLGCGTGGNSAAFAGDYDVLGLDPSGDAIALAQARFPLVRFIRTDRPDAAQAHLAQGGVMLITDVLEHVPDDRALLAAAVKAVPAGAHLIVTVPSDPGLWSRHDEQFGHYRRYTLESFRALWRELPVEERLLTPFNARLRPIIALIRRITRKGGSDLRIPAGPLNRVLHRIFAGEAPAMVDAMDRHVQPFRRGVSLAAVLRKR